MRPGTLALIDRFELLRTVRTSSTSRGASLARIVEPAYSQLSDRVALPPDDTSVRVTPVIGSDGAFELVGVYPEPRMPERRVETLGLSSALDECNATTSDRVCPHRRPARHHR